MESDQTRNDAPQAAKRRNPMYAIIAITIVGMAIIGISEVNDGIPSDNDARVADENFGQEADTEQSVVISEVNEEIPRIRAWILEALDDFELSGVADVGRLANEIKDVENYGPAFQRQQLKGRDFNNADLAGASFRYVDLEDASFKDANLQDALFGVANLEGVNFSGACLLNARFALAGLSNADFSDAYLVGASFEMTDDDNVDFSGAIREGEEKCPEGT